MPLTEQQTRLAATIDTHVTDVLAHGGGDEALLVTLADHMGTFKQLMDMSTGEEMNALCQRYDGFYPLLNCWRGWPRASPMAASQCLNERQWFTPEKIHYRRLKGKLWL
jgi:hypothetical protein